MTSDSSKKQERKLRNLANSILRREKDWLEISEYLLGDIQTEKTVYVANMAAVAGDILAPRVIIAGIVYGSIVGREVLIQDSGQVWGDVHAVAMEIAPSGRIQGWVSSLDEGTVDLLRSGELNSGDVPGAGARTLPAPLLVKMPDADSIAVEDVDETAARLAIWRQLRLEAATAQLARSELESIFEKRLAEAVNMVESGKGQEDSLDQVPSKTAFQPDLESGELDAHGPAGLETTTATASAYKMALEESQRQSKAFEAEVKRLQDLVKRAVSQAKNYQSRYLWTKASLDTVQKRLDGLETAINANADGLPQAGSREALNYEEEQSMSRSRNQQLAKLRATLVERDLELKKTQEKAANLAGKLKRTKQLAARRIRVLEAELSQAKEKLGITREK